MDWTPQLPRPPAPPASICRDLWWKTFRTPHRGRIRPIRFVGIFRVVARWPSDFAPHSVLFGCPAEVDLMAKGGRRPRIRRHPSSLTDLYFHDYDAIHRQTWRRFPLLFSDCSKCPYRIQRPVCRRAARCAAWERSGSESCRESDCVRSSTFTSAAAATRSRRSSRKRQQVAPRRRSGSARRPWR